MSKVPIVEKFMTRKVISLDAGLDIYEAILKMMKHDVSGAPVTEGKKLVGMISEKDCMKIFASAAYSNQPGGYVSDYMVKQPETVGPRADLFTVAGILMHRHYRRLPVVEGDELLGVVSRTDVLRASVELWSHPDGRDWTDSKYLTPELKAMLRQK